ncbi:MAG: hypothetical protein K2L64_03560, partial [Ureaplasma sp.]|nr:hypothetical protein [Ureaplasma sp.]
DYIDGDDNKKSFLNLFSKLFVGNNLTKNDIFVNGVDNYDPKKKNAIFIGSSLFRPISGLVTEDNYSRLDLMPSVLKEVQDTFAKFLTKYNPDEYNIIFKLHPVFSNSEDPKNLGAINYVNQITNGAINNPIIASSKIALESWIAADYNKYKNNPDNIEDSIIFRKTNGADINSAKEWTTFFGFQATTTTIHTTRLFYQSAFKINKNEVANLIPFSNFPVPKSFPVVERLSSDSTRDYTEDNIKRINSIFKAYCPSIKYDLVSNIDDLKEFDSIVLNF